MRPVPLIVAVVAVCLPSCERSAAREAADAVVAQQPVGMVQWERLTADAGYPPSYNFPIHVAPDGGFVALHSEGTWYSRDGRRWTRGPLPPSGLNSAYLKYVQHAGATWALGTLQGNHERFRVDPRILRTSTYAAWEAVGRAPTLPQLVFYAAVSFRGAIWLLGGYDRQRQETAEIWSSRDGVTWLRMLARAPWSPRAGASAIVFRDRLYLIGGGRIDGPQANDVWSSADGITWQRETDRITADGSAGSPVVFADRLWMVGANRSGEFASAVLVSDDGRTWAPLSAPWSPRGGVAVWVHGGALFMTGGKYSTVRNGATVFQYYSDVWRMRSTP